MAWRLSWFVVPLVLTTVTTLVLAAFAYRNRDKRTAPQVLGILLGASIWAGADAVTLAHTSESVMMGANDARFIGSTLLVFSVIVFALEHTNREHWLHRRYVSWLALPFAITVFLAVTEGVVMDHGLIRAGVRTVETAGLVVPEFSFGPWFWINAAYSYGLLLVALVLYVAEFVRVDASTYRQQIAALIVALLVPWLMNGFYLTGLTPVDLTGAGLAVTGVLFYASLFWLSLLDLVPIARGTVLDNIEQGVLVVDSDDTIVDLNPQMVDLLGARRDDLIGEPVGVIHEAHPELVGQVDDDRESSAIVSVERGSSARHYAVESSPIYSRTDRYLGRTVLVRDVTDRVRRRRQLRERTEELERQNERLDQFASIVSHDLRNPLNVADGYLEIARERSDMDELDAVAESHQRMEEIIDDVLTLARFADDAGTVEAVDLRSVANDAWQSVTAEAGSLVVDCDRTIEANRSRLKQLLENLFRNTFDHGPADATITVGVFDDRPGFFVEDDGPGIDADARDRIFEEGYSTAADGTGLGLAIVESVAERHGWSVTVTEGRSGGARFEFTGVTRVTTLDEAS